MYNKSSHHSSLVCCLLHSKKSNLSLMLQHLPQAQKCGPCSGRRKDIFLRYITVSDPESLSPDPDPDLDLDFISDLDPDFLDLNLKFFEFFI
jgi:hypothetical protein